MLGKWGDIMLTEEQLKQWDVFGFVTFKDLFSRGEADTIRREFDIGLSADQTYYPNGESPTHFKGLGQETPFLQSLAEDPRLLGPAAQMWGEDVISTGSDCDRFTSSNTYWHPDLIQGSPDTKENHLKGVKFACYLDSLDHESGALRLIPGSHRSPFHDELFAMGLKGDESPYLKKTRLSINDVPAYVWESEPTDMIAFNNRTWHASYGGSGDRRQVNVSYFKNASDAHEEDLNQKFSHLIKTLRSDHDQHQSLYPPDWLANRHNNPTVQHWIDWLKKYGHLE